MKKASNAIFLAIKEAENISKTRIRSAYITLPSHKIASYKLQEQLNISGSEINKKDIDKLLFQAASKIESNQFHIIHKFVYEYILDGDRGISSPLGMRGDILVSKTHIIAAPKNALINLTNCMLMNQIDISGYILAPYGASFACIRKDEMESGITFIEFGGDSTSISMFENNTLIFTSGISIGGISITNDIMKCFGVTYSVAEKLKNIYGTLIITSASAEIIEIEDIIDSEECGLKSIDSKMLSEVIRARVEEILDFLMQKIDNDYDKKILLKKIVISGGGANLNGLLEFIGYYFSAQVRIGYIKQSGFEKDLSCVAGIGAAYCIEKEMNHRKSDNSALKLNNIKKWFQDIFNSIT